MGFDAAHTISALSKLLIDAGADINQPDTKGRVALQYLISHPKLTDRDTAPLYDLPIDLAQKLPYRADLLRRMTE